MTNYEIESIIRLVILKGQVFNLETIKLTMLENPLITRAISSGGRALDF